MHTRHNGYPHLASDEDNAVDFWVTIAWALLVMVFILASSGCAFLSPKAAPEDKVAAARKVYTMTVTELTRLRANGHVPDATWKAAKEIAEGIDAAFDSLDAELEAGNKVDVDAALRTIRASVDRLATFKTEAERARDTGDSPGPAGPAGRGPDAGQGPVHARAA